MAIQIIKIDGSNESSFIDLPYVIYKNDPEFIPHIEQDIKDVFNPKKNKYLEKGEAHRWIAVQDNKTVGRIAAGYKFGEKEGRIGFFESINDNEVAHLLFKTAESYLIEKGVIKIEAPVNFGSRDSYWGLMVSGFKRPSYRENYNPPYYRDLILSAGYKEEFLQVTSEISPETFNIERFSKLSSRVLNNPDYEFKHIDYSQTDKFAKDFVHIYNKAWEAHDFYVPLTLDEIMRDLKQMKPIVKPEFNWFAYANGEPAAFYINVLDINQVFKHVNGKLNWLGKLKFLWYKGKIDRLRAIVFGVIPEYQNKGLETGMIMKMHEEIIKHPQFKSSELAWIGDFNPKMHSLFNSLGAVTSKEHLTFVKEI